jgi:hypothetical protein
MFLFSAWMVFLAIRAVRTLVEEYADPIMERSWRIGVSVLLALCIIMAVFDAALGAYWLIA